MFQAPDKIVNSGHRCGLVTGAKAVGKTTFVVSGSKFAPDTLPSKEMIDCSDVVIMQVEAESVLGALDMGLRPRVIDLSGVVGWPALNVALAKAIQFLRPLCESGDVRIVGVDLGAIDKEIRAFCAGMVVKPGQAFDVNTTFAAKDMDWNKVAAQAKALYDSLRTLPCLVIGMCHLKVADNNPMVGDKYEEARKRQELARDVQAIGGDATKLGADLAKGTAGPWIHNSSFIFAREVETKNVGTPLVPKLQSRYLTHTASNGIFEAGNRRTSRLQPVETRTLRAILNDMYSF